MFFEEATFKSKKLFSYELNIKGARWREYHTVHIIFIFSVGKNKKIFHKYIVGKDGKKYIFFVSLSKFLVSIPTLNCRFGQPL